MKKAIIKSSVFIAGKFIDGHVILPGMASLPVKKDVPADTFLIGLKTLTT